MENNREQMNAEESIDLVEYFSTLRPHMWKVVLFALGVGAVTLLLMFWTPNNYLSSATITPVTEDAKPIPAIGALASFGVSLGGPTKVEDLESLFRSNDLTVRVFARHNLWPIVMRDIFDPATGKMKTSWLGELLGREKGPKPPGDWDAIRAVKNAFKVTVNKKAGTIAIAFESPSAEGSAAIVKHYLDEAKSRLQEEALDRAVRNKKFIEEQIGRTVDALARERLYSLYGQEVEREMLAKNREQFGFRVIDSPRVPDRKSGPFRARSAVLAAIAGFVAAAGYFLARGNGKKTGDQTNAVS